MKTITSSQPKTLYHAFREIKEHTSFFRKGFVIKVDEEIRLVTLNLFEQILAPLFRLIGANYFSLCAGRKVTLPTAPPAALVSSKELIDILWASVTCEISNIQREEFRQSCGGSTDDERIKNFDTWSKTLLKQSHHQGGIRKFSQYGKENSYCGSLVHNSIVASYMVLTGTISGYFDNRMYIWSVETDDEMDLLQEKAAQNPLDASSITDLNALLNKAQKKSVSLSPHWNLAPSAT